MLVTYSLWTGCSLPGKLQDEGKAFYYMCIDEVRLIQMLGLSGLRLDGATGGAPTCKQIMTKVPKAQLRRWMISHANSVPKG